MANKIDINEVMKRANEKYRKAKGFPESSLAFTAPECVPEIRSHQVRVIAETLVEMINEILTEETQSGVTGRSDGR